MLLTLTGHSSVLSADFHPPILVDKPYGLALLSFHSYNSIPNIEEGSKLYLTDSKSKKKTIIRLPEGSYEIGDIELYIQTKLGTKSEKLFSLKPNNNTLKCEIYSELFDIDFRPADSIGKILGFSKQLLKVGDYHSSDLPVNIIKVRTIHIDTNITSGAFYNHKPSHTIHEFAVGVDPGFSIDEKPQKLIYLPVNKTEIYNITLRILDQSGELVNFRGEEIIVRLELTAL